MLRVSKEKFLYAVDVFGLVVPIDRSSRQHSLIDLAFASLVPRYWLLAVSKTLETNERRCLCSAISSGQYDRVPSLI